MVKEQFEGIEYFTPEEVERTDASLASVQLSLMESLDEFREAIGCPVRLLKNGMTTGDHQGYDHGNGEAADVVLGAEKSVKEVVYAALKAGFNAIGVYHNTITYSYHLGIRFEFALWSATKGPNDEWEYDTLFVDPKEGR